MNIQSVLLNNKEDIITMYNNNYSTNQIAKKYQCNSAYIWMMLKSWDITIRSRNQHYGIKKQLLSQIKILWDDGYSASQIAKKYNLAISSVCRWLKSINIDTSKYRTYNPQKLLIDRKEEVIKLFSQGNSCGKIAKLLKFSDSNVWKLLVKEGYKPTNIKYTLNESFFEQIDTQEKAYVLGWWYSDGNIIPTGKCRISLQERDKEILERISDILKYTGKLKYKIKNGNRYNQWELNIDRKKVANDLIKLGCVPNKSMILQFPDENIVPKALLSHFVRGYFDGDGSISNGIMIAGTYYFINNLSKILPCDITNIYQRYKNRPLLESSHQLFIGRSEEICKFYHWLYKDATIWLNRKRDKFIKKYRFGV